MRGTHLALSALVIGLMLLSLAAGRSFLPPAALWQALSAGPSDGGLLIWGLRLPRVLTALAVGAALGLSGAVFQSLLRNPLASPDLIGITQGAALGAVAALLAGGTTAGLRFDTVAGAWAGGLAATALIFALSTSRRSGTEPRRMVLYGIGCGVTSAAGVEMLILRAGDGAAGQAMVWLAGSLNGVGWPEAALAMGAALPLGVAVLLGHRALDRMELGDDLARALGIRVAVLRPLLIVAAALLASGAVAITGPLAFVAFVAGPMARGLHRRGGPELIGAALIGAALVLGADLAARLVAPAAVLPAGLYTAVIGAPWLIGLLLGRIRRGTL
ncbi:iron ABC transporter permease [Gemmobacter fulvus]|uniref:FecCD family ABC transporter permease n=1 Tax=Gemmobacter fulvus TaxID=2840474 RepID=UPI002796DB97|nr:iron ABC transporter permease [Gemmobacter fulvus]MDQ1846768.1 iron ABC transporter permease [Gemmobacter fulvus]